AMRRVRELIDQVAPTDADVLILGETGTGKELIARSLHEQSPRKDKRFVPVDCGAIPEDLMESELFGHERGAFTGADSRSLGLMEFADGGTFFLDEIGELSARLQAKLLRALQERRIRRVGGKEEIDVNVRIIAATARNLEEDIKGDRFRSDLYYRINVARIELPPLRERVGDIPRLARHFVGLYGSELGREQVEISPEAMEILSWHAWPGNVRELQNVIRRALTMMSGELINESDLPDEIVTAAGLTIEGNHGFFDRREERVNAFEKEYLGELLERYQGDVAGAAEEAQIPRGTLYRLLKKHDLNPADYRN
ncbi:MAG: sigma-54-dependent Fis family transcriptional regulator, partial [Pseudomonadales bacterium]|nr:sigma-54-dependent Fis family transcriptional regulator [Pseudomonadales bacterium]